MMFSNFHTYNISIFSLFFHLYNHIYAIYVGLLEDIFSHSQFLPRPRLSRNRIEFEFLWDKQRSEDGSVNVATLEVEQG